MQLATGLTVRRYHPDGARELSQVALGKFFTAQNTAITLIVPHNSEMNGTALRMVQTVRGAAIAGVESFAMPDSLKWLYWDTST